LSTPNRLEDGTSVAAKELGRGRFVKLVECNGWEFASRTRASGVVGVLARNPAGAFVLIEQFRAPLGQRVIEIAAGLVGDDGHAESLEEAARRELLEETGHEAGTLVHLGAFPTSAGLTDEIINLFWADDARQVGPVTGDGAEVITLHEVAPADLPVFLARRAAQGVLVDPKIYTALFLVSARPPASPG